MAATDVQSLTDVQLLKRDKTRQIPFPDGWAPKSILTEVISRVLESDWKEIKERKLYKSLQELSQQISSQQPLSHQQQFSNVQLSKKQEPRTFALDLNIGGIQDTKIPAEQVKGREQIIQSTTNNTLDPIDTIQTNSSARSGSSGRSDANSLQSPSGQSSNLSMTPVTASPLNAPRTLSVPYQTFPVLTIEGPFVRIRVHSNNFLEKFLEYWCYCDIAIINNFINIPKFEILGFLDNIINCILILCSKSEMDVDFRFELKALLDFHKKLNLTVNNYGKIGDALLLTLQECLADRLQNISKWKIAFSNLLPAILKDATMAREAFFLHRQTTRAILFSETGRDATHHQSAEPRDGNSRTQQRASVTAGPPSLPRTGSHSIHQPKGSPGLHPHFRPATPKRTENKEADDNKLVSEQNEPLQSHASHASKIEQQTGEGRQKRGGQKPGDPKQSGKKSQSTSCWDCFKKSKKG